MGDRKIKDSGSVASKIHRLVSSHDYVNAILICCANSEMSEISHIIVEFVFFNIIRIAIGFVS
jgi:hypothetical protein